MCLSCVEEANATYEKMGYIFKVGHGVHYYWCNGAGRA